jgi:murein DD-endopeptidase MepM/ murein hydrolase activator NlpD
MSTLYSNRGRGRLIPGRGFFYSLLAVAVLAGGYWTAPRFEWHKPEIAIDPDTGMIGLAPLEIEVKERGSGLQSFTVVLSSGGTEYPLVTERFDERVMEKQFTVTLSSSLAGLKEGPAVLRVSARDRSLWNFFRGNETRIERAVTIDITPPTIALIADDRYINFGGAGLIVYTTSPDTVTTGIKIGDYFFPGYKGQIKAHPDRFIAFFAHPYNVPRTDRATLFATDKAGNTREMRLAYQLMNVNYRKSTIVISDEFVDTKVAPLLDDVGARQGKLQEIFIRVNQRLRKENDDKITAITRKPTPEILWRGAFRQLSNSKVEANFADARTYVYGDGAIDHAYHLGYDLSVTRHYPVEAANSGKVVFTGHLGIYGNTVIIDHGLGLFTLYSHLSSIDAKEGDAIKQSQIIGRTGETGLAVGDHVHYGVYLHGVPVLPLEWWDQKWLDDNILSKLEGSTAAEAVETSGVKTPSKTARQRRR